VLLPKSFLAVMIVVALCGCAGTNLTPEQEWVMAKFSDCKTRTNAINVTLDRVEPNGNWHASMAQTQTEFNRIVECMNSEEGSAPLYRRLADAGNSRAMAALAWMYERGSGGLPKDDAEAVKWYRKGADAGNAGAMNNLAIMYSRGHGGLPQDDTEAAKWYRKGADAGSRRAMAGLGTMYETGSGGLEKNEAEALRWYRKSADGGDSYAMYLLGRVYERGIGVGVDRTQAVQWYRKAAAGGIEPAAQRLKALGE
jgi:TPR repeat protein